MKIVEIIPSFYPINGAERFVLDLSSSMSINNKIYIVSLYDNKVDIPLDLKENAFVEIIYLNKTKGIDFKCAKELKKLMFKVKPDVIHAHLDSLLTIWLSKIWKKFNVVYTFHTLINESVIGKKRKPKNILYKYLFKTKKIIPVAISDTIRNSICLYYNLSKDDVAVVYNGVPTKKFYTLKGYMERAFDFIYIGRFIDIKNPICIVNAFLTLKKEFKGSKMIMVGDGPLLKECKRISDEKINFTGSISDVAPYLKQSKSLIMASRYEGNPMVINEAVSSKCFVIAPAVGGIPDVINKKNGKTFVFNEQIEKQLYLEMKSFLENIDFYDKLTTENYVFNINNVSIEKTKIAYVNIFKRLIK